MTITQFIIARIYAKKMIKFLRIRQEVRRIEEEKYLKNKLKISAA
jgi:hypothetical protein